eukprot:16384-Heterococcus_DN1.PRE.1
MAWMLHQPGMQLCEQAMHVAAMNGHTVMCQFLHELQCPWDASCARDAALAARGGSVDALIYLQQQGFMISASTLADMLDSAGGWQQLAAARWLRAQGAQWPSLLAFSLWRGEALAWARAEGCPHDDMAYNELCSTNDIHTSNNNCSAWRCMQLLASGVYSSSSSMTIVALRHTGKAGRIAVSRSFTLNSVRTPDDSSNDSNSVLYSCPTL